MKFLMDNWSLVLVAFASGAMLLWPTLSRGSRAGALTAPGAVQLINRHRAVVVDLSDADEFARGHIVGAKSIPMAQLEQRLPEVVKNKALPVIFVCATGGKSKKAEAIAKNLGYAEAQALGGGLSAWKEASLPLQKS
ncbi:rhodanese-like domain-containing protein [Ramlibacter sp.]|uniref:rhodanese-like domain-containing protein n=1 Tax=Ramlibacter sp. TaxID=1917967 RepID=UPI003D137F3B